MTQKLIAPTLAALLCLVALGCQAGRPPATAEGEALELRTHAVPPAQAEALEQVLRSLLRRGDERIGTVQALPGGQLAVMAPAGVQEGVEELLKEVAEAEPPPPPQAIRLTYWIVRGTPGQSGDLPPVLSALRAPLAAVEQSQGPMSFDLFEKLSLTSISDRRVRTHGQVANVEHVASVSGGSVLVDVELIVRGGRSVKAVMDVPPGRHVVLAESGYSEQSSDKPAASFLFYIVQSALPAERG